MDKIRFIILVIGSVFFAAGMVWAGLLKWSQNHSLSGILYIISAAVIIAMCVLVYLREKDKG
ncbi:MAG: hypothetical protein HGA27_06280 [Peptococcaceae bacterium]|nr:hypothetical protein [Peptococcaceae bacterium]